LVPVCYQRQGQASHDQMQAQSQRWRTQRWAPRLRH